MTYNLLDRHKDVARWFVKKYREGELSDQITIQRVSGELIIGDKLIRNPDYNHAGIPLINHAVLEILDREKLIYLHASYDDSVDYVSLLQRIFTAVDTDFQHLEGSPLTSPRNSGGISIDLGRLTFLIHDRFSQSELQTICLNLGEVEYEDLEGSSRQDKSRELVQYMSRRGRLLELLITVVKARERADWSSLY